MASQSDYSEKENRHLGEKKGLPGQKMVVQGQNSAQGKEGLSNSQP